MWLTTLASWIMNHLVSCLSKTILSKESIVKQVVLGFDTTNSSCFWKCLDQLQNYDNCIIKSGTRPSFRV